MEFMPCAVLSVESLLLCGEIKYIRKYLNTMKSILKLLITFLKSLLVQYYLVALDLRILLQYLLQNCLWTVGLGES